MTQTWIQLLISVALLYGTAELLVGSACAVARRFGLTERVIGLTIVALGTSMPEVMVSVVAALSGSADVAVGNVLGSNICNIGLVLGGAALIRPLKADRVVLSRDLPLVLGATGLLYALAVDGSLGRIDGIILLSAVAGFVLVSLKRPGTESEDEVVEATTLRGNPVVLLVVSLVGVAVAAHLLVDAAVTLGQHWGISELVIGLTVVAFGTSLPEAATAWVGAARGRAGLTLGNALGSNIFNIGAVLGLTCLIRPLDVQGVSLGQDIPIALIFAFALVPILARTNRIGRREGVLLLAGYAAYIGLLALRG